MKRSRSTALFKRAKRVIPGGVNSPVRAYAAVTGGTPPFIERGRGSRVFDADGNEYIDYVGSWGPLILGHAHARVLKEVRAALARGTSFGAPTRGEIELGGAPVRLPSLHREGSNGELGNRGHHERDPPGSRGDRAQAGSQVRGVLPRPLRWPARGRRKRRGHAGNSRFAWSSRSHDPSHGPGSVQRSQGGEVARFVGGERNWRA